MEYKKPFISNIKTPISVLISAIFATFIFSIGKLFFDPIKYESLVWLFDTTVYSFLVSTLIDWILFIINKQRTIVKISFYNPTQRSNYLTFESEEQYKKVKVYINVFGRSHITSDVLRIYEPEGITLQLNNRPEYINVYDGSYYEINLSKLMGVEKEGKHIKKVNMQIKRTLEFQIALDDHESEYKDKLYVHRETPQYSHRFFISLKQSVMYIER